MYVTAGMPAGWSGLGIGVLCLTSDAGLQASCVDARGYRVTLQLCEGRLELLVGCQHLINGCAQPVRRAYEHKSQHDERDERPHKQQDDGEHGHWVTGRSRAPCDATARNGSRPPRGEAVIAPGGNACYRVMASRPEYQPSVSRS
jgi:hypothetical protein